MMKEVEEVEQVARDFESDLQELPPDQLKIKYLSRKGLVSKLLEKIPTLPPEQRRDFGKYVNDLKRHIEEQIKQKEEQLLSIGSKHLAQEPLFLNDLTLEGKRPPLGNVHVLFKARDELLSIFKFMGFSFFDGPELETDFYNFEALNFPPYHPARDMQDTLVVGDRVLRTHSSAMQVRAMEAWGVPIKVILPGRVYRREEVSARKYPVFYQFDCLAVGENIGVGHLKWTLETFLSAYFEKNVTVRFRPSYFPFVEPGNEVDVKCVFCDGQGCSVCGGTGWLEILGAGLVHPRVLEYAGVDPNRYSGFAFGVGVDRMAMLKYGINDIRLLYEGDVSFLRSL
ncbi:MAG TPA: phenylalanine--tRNA ligase subunit alpha [Coprothermobacter proteolyticus]|mgnify:FL=1|uniref:Phenylalanine--tRNA ligase alpha subunit n=1 Tax=Coprothermobacter proteolyticus (strain ATCC 35245 / DSM 5265 / OCM 4 / BT) TaxID=309798 RepID=B5Y859_COPPD|nr:phenylalanine--tRNA ligase subunit alpha [Coprothermobacter proteolyticus]MBK6585764.1 phenylalanine--tRNA ligase subunit alpha [Coprothermobacter sp.]ACI17140.1 phenylalanyl-tRNA synthetase subunit alpha [Coprothermobacter proteolyticus DSM 5265]MBP8984102.1 phenylalanine--tRNA ligase subunit alpha [Coprothermobacter sp.]HOA64231.1 phenylalanine--tRNA ligase subunit alpha [Coprothermobacter proteolyticus]HOK23861.1 phenylalanine--tRNA ligase subunit alpha [Coprothermobacter proteolyticus]